MFTGVRSEDNTPRLTRPREVVSGSFKSMHRRNHGVPATPDPESSSFFYLLFKSYSFGRGRQYNYASFSGLNCTVTTVGWSSLRGPVSRCCAGDSIIKTKGRPQFPSGEKRTAEMSDDVEKDTIDSLEGLASEKKDGISAEDRVSDEVLPPTQSSANTAKTRRKWLIAGAAALAAIAIIVIPTAVVVSRQQQQQQQAATNSDLIASPTPTPTSHGDGTIVPITPSKTYAAGATLDSANADEDGTPYPSYVLPAATWKPSASSPLPAVYRSWYASVSKRPAPSCDILSTPSSAQPTLAAFPVPFPAQPVPAAQVRVDLNNQYGLDEGSPDNFAAITRAILDCRNGVPASRGCQMTMKNGVYRFNTDRPIVFDRLVNFTLDGNNSIWLFSRKKTFNHLVVLDQCSSSHIQNLQIDWDYATWRLASLVRIEALWALSAESSNSGNGDQQIRMRFIDHPQLDLRTINSIADMHKVDPDTMTVGLPDPDHIGSFWQLNPLILRMEQQANPAEGTNNTVILTLKRGLWPAPTVGALYLVRHFTYEGHGIQVNRSLDTWLDHISIWGAPGMALASRAGSERIRITNFTLGILSNSSVDTVNGKPVPALIRRISSTADALNFIGTAGHIHIEDSELGFQGDDCSNAHPNILVGIERREEWSGGMKVLLKDWQRARMGTMAKGDVLEFRNGDFSPTGVFRTMVEEPIWTSVGWLATIDGKLPYANDGTSGLWSSDDKVVIFNLRHNATVSILYRRVFCHSNRGRGILFQLPTGGIEHSCFHGIEKRALSITADVRPGSWAEGMGIRDAYITNNRFENCDKIDDKHGVIWMGVQGADYKPSNYAVLQNVRITDNTLVNFPRQSVQVGSASNVVISGNRIFNDRADGVGAGERGQILVERSSGVRIEGNTWSKKEFTAGTLVSVDSSNARDVTISSNTVV